MCRVTPDGKQWELLAAGFRNPYDLAFNDEGELFTFDADMEHDIGTPWYRPTRVCHVVSGAEFGWRYGTGKWPSYSPDSVPPTLDIGLGSPTGVTFGYGADFPSAYQQALFVCDWTHGRLFALHLQPSGGTYSAEFEEFISGVPLPLTDVVINPIDKAVYFTTGGRRTQSGLYRVTWNGGSDESTRNGTSDTSGLRSNRRSLESFHRPVGDDEFEFVWENLGHEDRFIRYAARIALEHQDVERWRDRVFVAEDLETSITGLLALSRVEGEHHAEILSLATQLWDASLSDRQKTDLLRVLAISWSRSGKPEPNECMPLLAKLEADFPAGVQPLDFELCRSLVYLDSETVVPKSMKLIRMAKIQEDLLNYAFMLRVALLGWTNELRGEYLALLEEIETKAATGEFAGGGHIQAYIRRIRADVAKQMSAEEQERFAELLNPIIRDAKLIGSPTPRDFVRHWTVDELIPHLGELDSNRSFSKGRALFDEATCIACHRFDNRGGIFGPGHHRGCQEI